MAGVFSKPKIPEPKQEIVQPETPIVTEEASIELDDEDSKKKQRTGKGQLKIPIVPTADTGLKV